MASRSSGGYPRPSGGTGRDRYVLLDVEEAVVAIDIGTPEGSDFEAFLAEAMPIVETMQFGE